MIKMLQFFNLKGIVMDRSSLTLVLAALTLLLSAACGAAPVSSTPKPIASEVPSPTHTPSPEPTETPVPITVIISPNLDQAFEEGFQFIAGHPPHTVDFSANVQGGQGGLAYSWDFDGDGTVDSDLPDPGPFTYSQLGEYIASLSTVDESGQEILAQQRIVVLAEPEWPAWRYGVVAHLNRGFDLYASDAQVERAAGMISDVGIDVVRLDFAWSEIQPERRSEYDWSYYDYLVGISNEYGFDLFPIIDYSARWASTNPSAEEWQDWFFAPPRVAEFSRFAYEAANRYKGTVLAWQIWNEPNLSLFWRPEPDPVLYADLLQHAYLAIKYGDPSAVVVMAGLANYGADFAPQYVWYPPEDFLQVLYDSGAGKFFDAAARHPYTSPYEGTRSLQSRAQRLLSVMASNGDDGKPIWITESGYTACSDAAVTDAMQGQWVAKNFDTLLSFDAVPVVFWYNFREKGTDLNDCEHHFGLIEHDWTLKPAYEAYREYITTHP